MKTKLILAINLASCITLSLIVLNQRITDTEALLYSGLLIVSAAGAIELLINIKPITIKKVKMKRVLNKIAIMFINEFSNFFEGSARLDSNIL